LKGNNCQFIEEKIMGLEHLTVTPVSHGENQNYCWAASLSWWLKAVFNRNVSMDDIIYEYEDYINWEEGENTGGLNGKGLFRIMHDQRWHLHYDRELDNTKITLNYILDKLSRSPVIVAYYEPKVKGYHMNVIAAGIGITDSASCFMVMDPNFENFQPRSLQYYKNYYSRITFMYKAYASPTATYAYQ
jgi:hypothetical protein